VIEVRDCGCRTVLDRGGHVSMVSTCPICLPVGAITWLIEHGRQLELFEESGVTAGVRGLESIENNVRQLRLHRSEGPSSELPF